MYINFLFIFISNLGSFELDLLNPKLFVFDKLIKRYERDLKKEKIKAFLYFVKGGYGFIKVYAKNEKEAIKILKRLKKDKNLKKDA